MATGYQPTYKTGRDQPPIGGSALAPPRRGPVSYHIHMLQHMTGMNSVRLGPKSRIVQMWYDAPKMAIALLIEVDDTDAEQAEDA